MAGDSTDEEAAGARDAGLDDAVAFADGAMLLVTVAAGDERAGCLVGFHTQCSIEPPRHAVWLSKANRTARVAVHATHLGVHVLAEADTDLATRFGTETGDDVDKFAGLRATDGPGGAPLLTVTGARLVGRRVSLLDDGGDHLLVVVAPVGGAGTDPAAGGARPLRLAAVADLDPGHESSDRPRPVGDPIDP